MIHMQKITSEQRNKLLHDIYCEAQRTMLYREKHGRHQAIKRYKEYLNTMETPVRILIPRFDFRYELKLHERGLSVQALGYVLTLPFEERKQQFEFYHSRVKAYEKELMKV